ncbi:uncharacterized protein N7459_001055 [Penicillium hispanicum]|uniref:uncharacterized protein n=1 Tax=Penicillium hispanicum TaxID=1080232 RepID=UPI002541E0E3|nr:uncharacterized protein N7459_001055 [Penicillium hispanicum]KAJ5594847.1 hypothetical protein N7459_001055 [Penicillium hispanicum]
MFNWLLVPLLERIDARLVKSDNFNSTQMFRMTVEKYYLKRNNGFRDPEDLEDCLIDILICDFFLRCALQHEEGLLAQRETLLAKKNHADKKKVASVSNALHSAANNYWIWTNKLYFMEARLPAGPIKRAYYSLRQDPLWTAQDEAVAVADHVDAATNDHIKRQEDWAWDIAV